MFLALGGPFIDSAVAVIALMLSGILMGKGWSILGTQPGSIFCSAANAS